MKTKEFSIEKIMNGCDRSQDKLLSEIGDRLDYQFLQINGNYSLPADLPMLMDTLKMVIRLVHRARNCKKEHNCD